MHIQTAQDDTSLLRVFIRGRNQRIDEFEIGVLIRVPIVFANEFAGVGDQFLPQIAILDQQQKGIRKALLVVRAKKQATESLK